MPKYNPFTSNFDYIRDDADYVNVTGDTMTGDLVFTNPNGIILIDSSGVYWRVSVNTVGALVTTVVNFLQSEDANILLTETGLNLEQE